MQRRHLLSLPLLPLAASLAGCTNLMRPTMPPLPHAGFTAQASTVQVAFSATARYWLVMPKAAATHPNQRWPLLMFLHGSGERGTDLNKVRVHGPWEWLAKQPDSPFIVVAPQARNAVHPGYGQRPQRRQDRASRRAQPQPGMVLAGDCPGAAGWASGCRPGARNR